MQLNEKSFDAKNVEQTLITENRFITNLFAILSLPTRNDDSEDEEQTNGKDVHAKKKFKVKDTTRAKSLTELQGRLEAITSKKKLTYKEKLTKKSLKSRMKKKNKQDERNAQQKLLRAQKLVKSDVKTEQEEADGVVKTAKPVFNSEGKMVFSKFDFSNLGTKKEKKQERDPKKLLKNIEKENEILHDLEERGEVQKVTEIKEKTAWKNALAKSQGEKVKDDPNLLKKTVQRQEQKKRSSKKKWQAREDGVTKAKEERQRKRTENIDKRKGDKKKSKLKKAVKRGKIIPGF